MSQTVDDLAGLISLISADGRVRSFLILSSWLSVRLVLWNLLDCGGGSRRWK